MRHFVTVVSKFLGRFMRQRSEAENKSQKLTTRASRPMSVRSRESAFKGSKHDVTGIPKRFRFVFFCHEILSWTLTLNCEWDALLAIHFWTNAFHGYDVNFQRFCKQICIIGCYASKIAESLKSPRRTKLISARCFYIFLQPNIILEEIKRSF